MILIMLPLPQIDISIAILINPCSRFLLIFELTLIGLPRRVLNLCNIVHKLPIGIVDIFLQEGFNDGCFLVQ
jgi:hypothetical protein